MQRKNPDYSLFGLIALEIFSTFKEDLASGPELTGSLTPRGRPPSPHPPPRRGSPEGRILPPRSPEHHRVLMRPHPTLQTPPSGASAPGTQGSPAGCRVHQTGPALPSPDQGTVLGRQRAPGTQGGRLWQRRALAPPARRQGFADPTSQGTPVRSGLGPDDGPRAGPGTRQHVWDHQGGALAHDGPSFRGQTVEAPGAGTIVPAPITTGQAVGPGQPQLWALTSLHGSRLGDLR